MILALLGLSALLQQGSPQAAGQAGYRGATTPPSGDTVGYWQQHVAYKVIATLDENQGRLRADGTLTYRNNSPDTLREMYFHQYLNAFRPGSRWSAADARENRERFQNLGENDIGYERLTQAPLVQSPGRAAVPVLVDYPGAPDSTVMHLRLPTPLAPGDSLVIQFSWDARPSTVPRRQARRGRTWDFAQWFPKVAVYDRGGWEPNPLVPAGELYGEFGTYDVTMIVRDDQVLVSTGVPVSGDPGWARVSRTGPPRLAANAYGTLPAAENANVPAGYRTVRFYAENVHHFAWSASPDYRYEGGVYFRSKPPARFPTWDTVSVHVLFKPGDDTTWGGGRAVERTIFAAKWLESLWGPYAYPQISNVHRIDPGGTEFPMMIMDGSASQGLILHEFGHVFSYGILANNEWRSGWLDEGLTDYQTDWAQKLSPQDTDRIVSPPRLPEGYRVNGATIPQRDSAYLADWRLEILGRSEPIGTPAYAFNEFGVYNAMIYDRAKLMYGQLRELMGDSVFLRFTHDYYDRWALRHVDERAMRAAASRAYGRSLDGFFDQWVHGTGLMDYALENYAIHTDPSRSTYETVVDVSRRGELRHPMPVGVLTASGWTIGRAEPTADRQQVRIVTAGAPVRVELDPFHTTFDWDRRNNVLATTFLGLLPEPRFAFNWPWLNQGDRSHTLVALSPAAWYSEPQRAVVGLRARTNYLATVDLLDAGFAFASRNAVSCCAAAGSTGARSRVASRINVWARGENFYLPGMRRPLMDVGGGVNYVDGIFKADVFRNFDLSPFLIARGPEIRAKLYATVSATTDSLLVPEQWSDVTVGEIGGSGSYKTLVLADSSYVAAHGSFAGGVVTRGARSQPTPGPGVDAEPNRGYARADGSVAIVQSVAGPASQIHVRAYGGIARNAPKQRKIFASTADPFETFTNDLFRPRGAVFKQANVNYLPIGGAGLRGFAINTPLDAVIALNGEFVQRVTDAAGAWGKATLSVAAFADAGMTRSGGRYLNLPNRALGDAGASLIVRGKFYDRSVHVRLDAPIFVNQSGLAGGGGFGGTASIAPRWTITVGDLWR